MKNSGFKKAHFIVNITILVAILTTCMSYFMMCDDDAMERGELASLIGGCDSIHEDLKCNSWGPDCWLGICIAENQRVDCVGEVEPGWTCVDLAVETDVCWCGFWHITDNNCYDHQ